MNTRCSRVGTILLLLIAVWISPAVSLIQDGPCRSNSTHISWIMSIDDPREKRIPESEGSNSFIEWSKLWTSSSSRRLQSKCHTQTMEEAEKDMQRYLRLFVMQFDLPFLETLGFNEENVDLPDGLESGMIGETIRYALLAKIEFEYSDHIPQNIFMEYVLNYANVNEARSNWRPLFWKKLRHLVQPGDDIASVVHSANANIWKILAPPDQNVIYFKGGSTPLIFDPMSILAFGYASCTGVAILLVNALRTLGVPARLVGTPAWNQKRDDGNHNWVEVWSHGEWHFFEPSLSADPSTPADTVDDLHTQPCQKWFCSKDRFTGVLSNTTLVYAARLQSPSSTFYPLAWEWMNHDVPGDDVTAFYREKCWKC